ncbi:hypothetical protein H180DRAFT_01554 [Streptomyces sp. WMMB 322]|nr:hypothetical protein H180DRAFT_01554 [Streptomyces sp. WMMB 322]
MTCVRGKRGPGRPRCFCEASPRGAGAPPPAPPAGAAPPAPPVVVAVRRSLAGASPLGSGGGSAPGTPAGADAGCGVRLGWVRGARGVRGGCGGVPFRRVSRGGMIYLPVPDGPSCWPSYAGPQITSPRFAGETPTAPCPPPARPAPSCPSGVCRSRPLFPSGSPGGFRLLRRWPFGSHAQARPMAQLPHLVEGFTDARSWACTGSVSIHFAGAYRPRPSRTTATDPLPVVEERVLMAPWGEPRTGGRGRDAQGGMGGLKRDLRTGI